MPAQSFRIGPALVSIFQPTGSLLPSASGVGFTATASTPTTLLLNDIKQPLTAGTNYQVIFAFLGQDTVNGGYTVTQSSSAAGAVTPTAGQGILVNIPAANLPGGATATPAVAMFLKAGNGNYTLAEFAYLNVNSGTDFNHMIVAAPLSSAPGNFTASVLTTGNGTNATLGSRLAGGWTSSTLSPTTGGVTVTRDVTQVTVSPDTSADFQIVTTRTAQISFQLLPNDIINIVQGNAGDYVQYTASNGLTIEEAQMSINTAAALITGNSPMTLLLPPDSQGLQETRLYLGQLLRNQQQNVENWRKTEPTPVSYTYNAVSVDTLIISEHSEVTYKQS